ncbi:hypothetical protein TKK_0003613 [Trichogramma kaykai]
MKNLQKKPSDIHDIIKEKSRYKPKNSSIMERTRSPIRTQPRRERPPNQKPIPNPKQQKKKPRPQTKLPDGPNYLTCEASKFHKRSLIWLEAEIKMVK